VCAVCGLPEFTPTAEGAPLPVYTGDAETARSKRPHPLLRPRTRVGLLIAAPLIWLTMCRLPDAETVRVPSGKAVQVVGMVRNTEWSSSAGKSRSLILTYYVPPPTAAATSDDLLSLALPAVQTTGDSIVVLEAVRGDWWARAFGIRVATTQRYRLQPDGGWVKI
jgi:hypothetical protein